MERETNAILDAVLRLNENQARRGKISHNEFQQATNANNSAMQSDAGVNVISNVAISRVSSSVIFSVFQQRVQLC